MANLIIAGAGPGIGLATAQRFAAGGWTVSLVARSAGRLADMAGALAETGARVLTRTADCARPGLLSEAIGSLADEGGGADVLLYNAARLRAGHVLEEDPEALSDDFRVNVAGALAATQAVLPAMRTAGSGTLLYTGSMFGTSPQPYCASLSIGKAGLRNLVLQLEQVLSPEGLRVSYLDIRGRVAAGDAVRSPEAVAGLCWSLHHGDTAPVEAPL